MGATRTLRCIQYEPTQLIITALERLHREGVREATLADVVIEATRINQPLAVKVFFTRNRRDDILTSDGDINEPALNDPTVQNRDPLPIQIPTLPPRHPHHRRHRRQDVVLDNEWQLNKSSAPLDNPAQRIRFVLLTSFSESIIFPHHHGALVVG